MRIQHLFFLIVFYYSEFSFCQSSNGGLLFISTNTEFSTVQEFNNTSRGDLINDGSLFLYSHFNNDGLTSFSSNATKSKTFFIGNIIQKISGSMPIEWYDVVFDNSNSSNDVFLISNEVNVFNSANFSNGILNTKASKSDFIFHPNTTHSSVSDRSYIDGLAIKKGSQEFIFPVGNKGKFRYSKISAPTIEDAAFDSDYHFENSNSLYPHNKKAGIITKINDKEFWTVDRLLTNEEVFLTLSVNESTTSLDILNANPEDVHIVRWNETADVWVDEGGVFDKNTKEVSTAITPLKSFGVFTLAIVNSGLVLPCNGKGVVVYNAVSLSAQGNNSFFRIEGIEECPNNEVEIYNRWGKKVYDTKSYNTNGNVFKGYSDGKLTINKNEKLPNGTYFYFINFINPKTGNKVIKSGYLYLND